MHLHGQEFDEMYRFLSPGVKWAAPGLRRETRRSHSKLGESAGPGKPARGVEYAAPAAEDSPEVQENKPVGDVMPRRTKLRRNTQKAKHLKRPRSWHRKSKKSIPELWMETKRLKERQAAEAETGGLRS